MRRSISVALALAVTHAVLAPAAAAPTSTLASAAANSPATAALAATSAPVVVSAAAKARTETMTHWSCLRNVKATVSVTWVSGRRARISWRLWDKSADGLDAVLRIRGVDWRGSKPAARSDFFRRGVAKVSGGGRSRSGSATLTVRGRLDEVEAWIWSQAGSRKSSCGPNVVKRLNDVLHSPARTNPTSYQRSKALRDRIVATAWKEYRRGYREYGNNCSKYTNAFYEPDHCTAWCANFAWWIWSRAGVPGAKLYNSSYTDDFADEWRVRFKPTGGKWKPARGDVIVFSHRTDGINGHIGVVVATDGWRVKVVQGNWGDRVATSGWINPFTARQNNGQKRVIGFASPV